MAAESWAIFFSIFVCRRIHNRVQIRRNLHEQDEIGVSCDLQFP